MLLKRTLRFIGIVQLLLGSTLVLAPGRFATMLGLAEPPAWTHWLFAMTGARFLAMGVGMFVAARDPARHRVWIELMIGVQAIDWAATVFFLADGTVTLAQVTTAAFLPPLFIALLAWRYPRGAHESSQESRSGLPT